jgi:hypothetical protein
MRYPLVLSITAVACALSSRHAPAPPSQVIETAVRVVRSEMGDGPYDSLVTLHPEWTTFQPAVAYCGKGCLWPWQTDYFVVFFTLQLQPTPLPLLITIPISAVGQPIPGFPSAGAPLCAAQPSQCTFPVSRDSARSIAVTAGLPPGIEPWSLKFLWLAPPRVGDCVRCAGHFAYFGEWRTYGWEIITVLQQSQGTATGEALYIDATSGRVLGRHPWHVVSG